MLVISASYVINNLHLIHQTRCTISERRKTLQTRWESLIFPMNIPVSRCNWKFIEIEDRACRAPCFRQLCHKFRVTFTVDVFNRLMARPKGSNPFRGFTHRDHHNTLACYFSATCKSFLTLLPVVYFETSSRQFLDNLGNYWNRCLQTGRSCPLKKIRLLPFWIIIQYQIKNRKVRKLLFVMRKRNI